MNTENKNSKRLVTRIGEAIRFQKWVDKMDQKDKILEPAKRRKKWMIILAGLFFLYLLSFLIPTPRISHQTLQEEDAIRGKGPVSSSAAEAQKPLTFDMSVDSFETILKKNINEKLPEKK